MMRLLSLCGAFALFTALLLAFLVDFHVGKVESVFTRTVQSKGGPRTQCIAPTRYDLTERGRASFTLRGADRPVRDCPITVGQSALVVDFDDGRAPMVLTGSSAAQTGCTLGFIFLLPAGLFLGRRAKWF